MGSGFGAQPDLRGGFGMWGVESARDCEPGVQGECGVRWQGEGGGERLMVGLAGMTGEMVPTSHCQPSVQRSLGSRSDQQPGLLPG